MFAAHLTMPFEPSNVPAIGAVWTSRDEIREVVREPADVVGGEVDVAERVMKEERSVKVVD